jgi:2-methylcitrate dehydratase PrpD
MSDGELSRLEVLRDLDQRRLTAAAAAQLLGLERRQVYRLLKAYRTEGPAGLISKRRGRSSNRRKPEAVRTKALIAIGLGMMAIAAYGARSSPITAPR